MTKRRPVLKQANRLLPSEVTDSFVTDLKHVLSQDGSVRARYLSNYWLSKFTELDPKAALQRRTLAIEKWRSVEDVTVYWRASSRQPSIWTRKSFRSSVFGRYYNALER